MAKTKFGVAVDEETVQKVDVLVAECDDLGANRSDIIEAILTAFFNPNQTILNESERSLFENEKAHSS